MQMYYFRLFSVCSIISLSARCSCKKSQPTCTDKQQARADFIHQFLGDTDQQNLNRLEKSRGIAFVVLSTYQGEVCVLLGREREGKYKNKLSFIGGKVEGHSYGNTPLMKVVAALYDEVYEELGISLTYDAFRKSLLGLDHIVSKRCNTMICFCHLSDIVIQHWTDMYKKRRQQNVAWAYQEFSEIAYVPINDLEARKHDISSYVYQNIARIRKFAQQMATIPAVSKKEFPIVKDGMPMLE